MIGAKQSGRVVTGKAQIVYPGMLHAFKVERGALILPGRRVGRPGRSIRVAAGCGNFEGFGGVKTVLVGDEQRADVLARQQHDARGATKTADFKAFVKRRYRRKTAIQPYRDFVARQVAVQVECRLVKAVVEVGFAVQQQNRRFHEVLAVGCKRQFCQRHRVGGIGVECALPLEIRTGLAVERPGDTRIFDHFFAGIFQDEAHRKCFAAGLPALAAGGIFQVGIGHRGVELVGADIGPRRRQRIVVNVSKLIDVEEKMHRPAVQVVVRRGEVEVVGGDKRHGFLQGVTFAFGSAPVVEEPGLATFGLGDKITLPRRGHIAIVFKNGFVHLILRGEFQRRAGCHLKNIARHGARFAVDGVQVVGGVETDAVYCPNGVEYHRGVHVAVEMQGPALRSDQEIMRHGKLVAETVRVGLLVCGPDGIARAFDVVLCNTGIGGARVEVDGTGRKTRAQFEAVAANIEGAVGIYQADTPEGLRIKTALPYLQLLDAGSRPQPPGTALEAAIVEGSKAGKRHQTGVLVLYLRGQFVQRWTCEHAVSKHGITALALDDSLETRLRVASRTGKAQVFKLKQAAARQAQHEIAGAPVAGRPVDRYVAGQCRVFADDNRYDCKTTAAPGPCRSDNLLLVHAGLNIEKHRIGPAFGSQVIKSRLNSGIIGPRGADAVNTGKTLRRQDVR